MALPADVLARLNALADARGLDDAARARLLGLAERELGGAESPAGEKAPSGKASTLFAYLLPFLTVREVRRTMGVDAPMPGVPDDMNAGELAYLAGAGRLTEWLGTRGASAAAALAPEPTEPAPAAPPRGGPSAEGDGP